MQEKCSARNEQEKAASLPISPDRSFQGHWIEAPGFIDIYQKISRKFSGIFECLMKIVYLFAILLNLTIE